MKTIVLTKGFVTVVCDCHYNMVKDYKWCAFKGTRGGNYAYKYRMMMHRLITNAPTGMSVDHVNGNTLDNRCNNLRVCTQSQNNSNQRGAKAGSKSGVKGIYWHKDAKKWCAEVTYNKKKHYLGLFNNLEDARVARNEKARELHGEFYYPS